MKNNQELKEKIDTIDKKLDLLNRTLNNEFKEIRYRDMSDRADAVAYALLTVGAVGLTAFIALKDWVLIVLTSISWAVGVVLQLYIHFKIKKLKRKQQKQGLNKYINKSNTIYKGFRKPLNILFNYGFM